MRIFKNTWFDRFARKAGISDADLKAIVADLENGIWDANYGGDVYKKRIARAGAGKSGGYRNIIVFRSGKIAYFIYGFAKSDKDDIDGKEQRYYKMRASNIIALTDEQIQVRLNEGSLIEVT